VSAATGSPSIQQVAMANVNDDLHVCATSGPRVLHAVRSQNGSWTKFGDVLAQTGSPPNSVVAVDCAGIGAELHIVMTTFDGGVFHAIRHADGTWTRLGNVQTAAGLGSASVPTVAKFGNDLQLTVVSNSNAREFNTVRHTSNGSWTLAAMLPNSVQVFDHASAGGSLFLHLVSIERGISQQVIWHRTRDIFSNWGPLVNVTSATGISAFPTQVTAAVTAGF
jgi:hypothetical protein